MGWAGCRADPVPPAPPRPQLSLNNKQLSQMLKSSAPAQEEEEDPLAYYENHTSQIEVRWERHSLGVSWGRGGGAR